MTDNELTPDQEGALGEERQGLDQVEEVSDEERTAPALAEEAQGRDQPPDDEKEEGALAEGAQEQEELSDDEKDMAKLKEAICVQKEEIGALRLKLTITVPQTTLDERRGEQFEELKRDALVPGFRKGRAPLELVQKRFGADVGEQLKGQLIGKGYLAAVEKEGLKPLGDPLFWVKVKEERVDEEKRSHKVETEKLLPIGDAVENMVLPKDGPLTFCCEVELKPEFELPELKKIPVKRLLITVSDEDVEKQLKRMQVVRGAFQPVEDGPAALDDLLYADMKMSVDGEVIATEESFTLAARDVRVRGVPLVGFGQAVAGKSLGDTVTIEASVPDDHENIGIRGKTTCFEFVIREIKRLVVPPLDQELLAALGYDSEGELHSAVRSSLEVHLRLGIRQAMRAQVAEYLVDNMKLDIPAGLSQRQTDRSVARRMIEMYQEGLPQAEIEKRMDELRARAHDQAVRDLKLYFILEKIAEERDFQVSEEQINAAIAQIARRSNKRFDRVRDELSKADGLMTLYLQLRDEQVLDALLDGAEITETAVPESVGTATETGDAQNLSEPTATKTDDQPT
jgi:trigger factor